MVGVIATSFQMVYARTVVFGVPDPTIAMLTRASLGTLGHSQASLPQSPVRVTAPFSWLLVCTRFCLCPLRVSLTSPMEVMSSSPTGLQGKIP